jgi:hypothetical protein
MGPGMRDALILLGALLLVVIATLVWAAFIRREKRRHRHHHHASHHRPIQAGAAGVPAETKHEFRKRRRRRRREHRPRNPTLAETGGLPPIREPEPPGPAQTQTH